MSNALAEMTAFEFYKTKKELPQGSYLIIEHDGSKNVVTLDEYGCEKWMDVSAYEESEAELIRDLQWANDGLDLMYGED